MFADPSCESLLHLSSAFTFLEQACRLSVNPFIACTIRRLFADPSCENLLHLRSTPVRAAKGGKRGDPKLGSEGPKCAGFILQKPRIQCQELSGRWYRAASAVTQESVARDPSANFPLATQVKKRPLKGWERARVLHSAKVAGAASLRLAARALRP